METPKRQFMFRERMSDEKIKENAYIKFRELGSR